MENQTDNPAGASSSPSPLQNTDATETKESLKAQIAKLTKSLRKALDELQKSRARELNNAAAASAYQCSFNRLKRTTLHSIKVFLDAAGSSYNESIYKEAICEFTHAVVMASLEGVGEGEAGSMTNRSRSDEDAKLVETLEAIKQNLGTGNDKLQNSANGIQAIGMAKNKHLTSVSEPSLFQQRNPISSTNPTMPELSPRQQQQQGSPHFQVHQLRQFNPYIHRGPAPDRFLLHNNRRMNNFTPPGLENWQPFEYNNNVRYGLHHQAQGPSARQHHQFPSTETGRRFPEPTRVSRNPEESACNALPFIKQEPIELQLQNEPDEYDY